MGVRKDPRYPHLDMNLLPNYFNPRAKDRYLELVDDVWNSLRINLMSDKHPIDHFRAEPRQKLSEAFVHTVWIANQYLGKYNEQFQRWTDRNLGVVFLEQASRIARARIRNSIINRRANVPGSPEPELKIVASDIEECLKVFEHCDSNNKSLTHNQRLADWNIIIWVEQVKKDETYKSLPVRTFPGIYEEEAIRAAKGAPSTVVQVYGARPPPRPKTIPGPKLDITQPIFINQTSSSSELEDEVQKAHDSQPKTPSSPAKPYENKQKATNAQPSQFKPQEPSKTRQGTRFRAILPKRRAPSPTPIASPAAKKIPTTEMPYATKTLGTKQPSAMEGNGNSEAEAKKLEQERKIKEMNDYIKKLLVEVTSVKAELEQSREELKIKNVELKAKDSGIQKGTKKMNKDTAIATLEGLIENLKSDGIEQDAEEE